MTELIVSDKPTWDIATETYKATFPEATVIQKKIEEIDPFQYRCKFRPDVLLTSPECTAHSIARGAKPGTETSRETAISIFPWIGASFNPRWVIVENVATKNILRLHFHYYPYGCLLFPETWYSDTVGVNLAAT